MEFCQIRSNSIEKDNGNYKWVSYGKPCLIPIPCTAHSSAIDHTIPFPNLGHVWPISNGLVRASSTEETPPTAATQFMVPPANLPPPKLLIMDDNLAKNWKKWEKAWKRYEIAAGIYKQEDLVRVSTLLSVIGEDAVREIDTFVRSEGQKEYSINDVLTIFDEYCEPRPQVIYERYGFNNRKQEASESISAYVTELRVIDKNCAHDEITPDEILRDPLVLWVWDDKESVVILDACGMCELP